MEDHLIFEEMKSNFKEGVFKKQTVFCFRVNGKDITIYIDSTSFRIENVKTTRKVDCFCEIDENTLKKIWYDNYKPSLVDIMTGKIKPSDPLLLKNFLKAFGRK